MVSQLLVGACGPSIAIFDVLQAGVQHFFDAVQLGAPQVAHFDETAIDDVESHIHVTPKVRES